MAQLILEVSHRGEHRYHRVDRPVLRVGRALDNDIILSDPTVSPHHFEIRQDEGGAVLQPVADENGVRVGGRRLQTAHRLEQLPLAFDAGRTRLRLLSSDQAVAPTRPLGCRHGRHCLFDSWAWTAAVFLVLLLVSAWDNYLSTPQVLSWDSFGRDQLTIVLLTLGIAVGLALINRVTAHRWEFPAALTLVGLLLLTATLLDQLKLFSNYFFASATPGLLIDVTWYLLIAPLALIWFLVRLNHGHLVGSVAIVLLLSTPAAYLQAKETVTHYGWFDVFSKQAHYDDSLIPWDLRAASSIDAQAFGAAMREALAEPTTPPS